MPIQDSDSPIARGFSALPDMMTSAMFLCAWTSPGMLGYQRVRDLMLLMLIEFIVMHSSAFTAAILSTDNVSRFKRALFLVGLTAFYMMFVLAFSFAFASTWPIWGFLWLFVSRFLQLFTSNREAKAKLQRLWSGWLVSALAYIGGVFLTAFLPLPSLGITPEVIANLHLTGSGLWIDKPWTVLAFGTIYFALLAWSKIKPLQVTMTDTATDKAKL